MSFDGVFTHVLVKELQEQLLGGRVAKIQQPYAMEVVMTIRARGRNHKLLLSAHPSYARVQLTQLPFENPATAPNFAMMLRKYLDGAILEKISQVDNDRVLHFSFSRRNELGDLEDLRLVVELMGRHSTILLLNAQSEKIIDAIKHVGPSQNTYRLLLPGIPYIAPPLQYVENPFTVTEKKVFEILHAEELTPKYLQTSFQGLGTDTATELCYRLNRNPQDKLKTWQKFFESLETPKPTISQKNNKEFFTPISYFHLLNIASYSSLSEMLDAFYGEKAQKDRVKQLGANLQVKMQNEFKKNQKKLAKLEQTLADTENAESYRRNGELLTTFLNQVPRGATKVTLANYYDEDKPLDIALRVDLTPNQNAQKYFQKYQKAKNAVKIVQGQIEETKQELAYLESVIDQIELASPLELNGIQEELQTTGYLKAPKKKMRTNKAKPQFQKFIATSGDEILVGRNNLQNDLLTLKTAKKTDIWLHVKNIPGSHVIIKNPQPTIPTIMEAAKLAAYFSKFRLSSNVPVDYVACKFVHKPNGAKPGFVIYENQSTVYVTPEESLVKSLAE